MRTCVPSHLLMAVKMTVFAGMLRPMAKVSVANRHCVRRAIPNVAMAALTMQKRHDEQHLQDA